MASPTHKTNPSINLLHGKSANTFDVTVKMGDVYVTYQAKMVGFGKLNQDKTNIIQQFTKAALTALGEQFSQMDNFDEESLVLESLQADGIHGQYSAPDLATDEEKEFTIAYSQLTKLPKLVTDQALSQKLLQTQQSTAKKTADLSELHFSQKDPDPIWKTVVAYVPPEGTTKPYQDEISSLPGQAKEKEKKKETEKPKKQEPEEKSQKPETKKTEKPTPAKPLTKEEALWKEYDEEIENFQNILSSTGEISKSTLESQKAKDLLARLEALKQKITDSAVTQETQHIIADKLFAVEVAINLLQGRKVLLGYEQPYQCLFSLIELLSPPKQRYEISKTFSSYLGNCAKGKIAKNAIKTYGDALKNLLPQDSILLYALHNFCFTAGHSLARML